MKLSEKIYEKRSFSTQHSVRDFFCNRTKERAKLAKLLERGAHIWLQAHRRHGKTSLLTQTGKDMEGAGKKIAIDRCHLLFSSGAESIISQLIKTTEKLMGKVATVHAEKEGYTQKEALFKYLSKHFSNRELDVSLDRGMPSIRLKKSDLSPTIETLREALAELDRYASQTDVRVIFIIDEFQELGKAKNGIPIESAIRDRLELADATAFVFCGSERSLMAQSLTDQKRPLYNHTKPFPLERIGAEHYIAHIKKLSIQNNEWNDELSSEVINRILELTERHPYYVNALCSDLWTLSDLPTIDDIKEAWNEVIKMAEREEKELILHLKPNEKKVLTIIALGYGDNMFSAEAVSRSKLGNSTIQAALHKLIEKDVIEKVGDQTYGIVNPVLTEIARRNS